MSVLQIPNRTARALWLDAQGLAEAPTGNEDLAATVRKLGYVQLDSIPYLARAHDHILWSRHQSYRPAHLHRLMSRDRAVFEHFSHDACILPMETYPYWRRQMGRMKAWVEGSSHWARVPGATDRQAILDRIRAEGALSTKAFDTKIEGKREMWTRPPHKLALDYMWYAGDLGTCFRQNFVKYYNLAERIVPDDLRKEEIPQADQANWLHRAALDRLVFATPGEMQRFWHVDTAREVKAWIAANPDAFVPVEVQGADGTWTPAMAPPDIEARMKAVTAPTSRLRILNPFDPVIRDRDRLARLFGFDYRIEIFVPAAKRIWGYYVCPILEGDRIVGRIEAKSDRKAGALRVVALWPERGVKWTAARAAKLDGELTRLARFCGLDGVNWSEAAQRAS